MLCSHARALGSERLEGNHRDTAAPLSNCQRQAAHRAGQGGHERGQRERREYGGESRIESEGGEVGYGAGGDDGGLRWAGTVQGNDDVVQCSAQGIPKPGRVGVGVLSPHPAAELGQTRARAMQCSAVQPSTTTTLDPHRSDDKRNKKKKEEARLSMPNGTHNARQRQPPDSRAALHKTVVDRRLHLRHAPTRIISNNL